MEKHNLTVYDAAHLEFARLYQLPLGTFRWRFAEGSIDGRLAAVVSQNETQIQIPSKTERKAFFSAYYERAERQAMTLLDQGFHLGGVIRVSRDLFVQPNVIEFCRQATRWCLALRQPFAHLLGQVLSTFLPKKLVKTKADPWVNPHFQRRYRDALAGYSRRSTLFRPRPSLTMNLSALNNLRRQLACSSLSPELPCEKRYPYLDRDLLEFIYSIPRSQLVRPGQRRSLMRRAFRGIVPDEIIDRKRKAFAVRSPLFAFATNDPLRGELKEGMLSDLFGYVDFRRLAKTIEIARQGGEAPMAALVRTITLEHWLRHLSKLNAIELNQRVRDGKTMPKSKKGWHRVTADTYR